MQRTYSLCGVNDSTREAAGHISFLPALRFSIAAQAAAARRITKVSFSVVPGNRAIGGLRMWVVGCPGTEIAPAPLSTGILGWIAAMAASFIHPVIGYRQGSRSLTVVLMACQPLSRTGLAHGLEWEAAPGEALMCPPRGRSRRCRCPRNLEHFASPLPSRAPAQSLRSGRRPARRDARRTGARRRYPHRHAPRRYRTAGCEGGSRPGSRGSNSRSTPLDGPKCARMMLARSCEAGLRPTASRRISRASSSMERPFPAARVRNRVFTSSSRLRIVMLAMSMLSVRPGATYATIAMQSSHRR